MKNHGLRIVFMSVLILISNQNSFARDGPGTTNSATLKLSLERATETALRENPSLASIQQRYQALLQIPSQAGSLPDPMISVGAMNFPSDGFNRSQEPMTQVSYGISQAFPFPGKLRLKKEVAELDAQGANFSVDEARLQLIKDVRVTWWDIFYVDHALTTLRLNQDLFRKLIEVATTKYKTGEGLQQDVLLAQLELSLLLDQEIKLKAIRQTHADRLNVFLARSPVIKITLPEMKTDPIKPIEGITNLISAAKELRPFLKKKTSDIEMAETRVALAKRDYYPDFTVGLSYGDRTGNNPDLSARDDLVSLNVGIKIPLYARSKQAKVVGQRTSELSSQIFETRDIENEIFGMISTTVTQYDKAREEFSLYETGIVPQATQTVQSMQAGYQVNEVDFLNLIRSQITLLNYQLSYWNSYTEAKQALARLEAVVGKETIYE